LAVPGPGATRRLRDDVHGNAAKLAALPHSRTWSPRGCRSRRRPAVLS